MALQFIGIDPGTDGSDCPTVWVDDTTVSGSITW